MSNSDSFIDEVTEELQRDRMVAILRRYGWIAGVMVAGIVGGAAYVEYDKSRTRAAAQELGAGLLAALDAPDRVAALSALNATGDAGALVALQKADQIGTEAERGAAIEALAALSAATDVDPIYRDLASLKLVILQGGDTPAQERLDRLETLSAPGAAFRVLAQEQKALILSDVGDSAAALAVLRPLLEDQETTQGLRQRVTQMIVALGGEV